MNEKMKGAKNMKSPIYSAEFISGPEEWLKQCPIFSREFNASGEIAKATLYVSALGVYNAFINGKRVGEQVLTPGWTDYKTRVQYQTEDVTDLVANGTNDSKAEELHDILKNCYSEWDMK